MKTKNYLRILGLSVLLLFSLNLIAREKTISVMAPLHVRVLNNPKIMEPEDWVLFEECLKNARSYGVFAVTVDVWWGLVQADGKNAYNWGYYDSVATLIQQYDLKFIPIMSFHKCGGNVGDNFECNLPEWIWQDIITNHPEIDQVADLKYRSSKNNVSDEYIALWADKYAMDYYKKFMIEFSAHYNKFKKIIPEVNISCGPSGELRYPSYNIHDSWVYPDPGFLQCYSDPAIEDFRQKIKEKYIDIKAVNKAWNDDLNSFSEVSPPTNSDFFSSGDYKNITYGKDFTTWYNECLIEHGRRILSAANDVLSGTALSDAEIGFKIPGIHWQIVNPSMPRAAEIASGLINSRAIVCDNINADTAGYGKLLAGVVPEGLDKKKVTLHFTCLEMCNNYQCNHRQNAGCPSSDQPPCYSMAEALVFWFSNTAVNNQINIKGENALQVGYNDKKKWGRIDNALSYASYKGVTILRIDDVCRTSQSGPDNYFVRLAEKYK